MRILLLESAPGVGTSTSEDLTADGHDVVRCHAPDRPSFPCLELESPGACPLGNEPAVDCAVVVHASTSEPTASEGGVSCALRHNVPVVARAWSGPSPFDGWAVPVGGAGVVAACRTAIDAGLASEVRPLVDEVHRLLEAAGHPPADHDVSVSIRRTAGRTRVEVVLPADAPVDHGTVATRVHARYGEGRHPGSAAVVDIAVRTATVDA